MTLIYSYVMLIFVHDERRQISLCMSLCNLSYKNKINCLLNLIFIQNSTNLEEDLCAPEIMCPPNLNPADVILEFLGRT